MLSTFKLKRVIVRKIMIAAWSIQVLFNMLEVGASIC